MKNLTSVVSGLASSLLLNAGFEKLARKIDPISGLEMTATSAVHAPAMSYPCAFALNRQD